LGCSISDLLHGTLQVELGSYHAGGLVECVDRARFVRKGRSRKFDVSDERNGAVEYISVSSLLERRKGFEQGLCQRSNSTINLR
jgi:hypothetical protein